MRSFKAGKQHFKIRRVQDLGDELKSRSLTRTTEELFGIMLPEEGEILIERGSPRAEASTLHHELIHASDPSLREERVRRLEAALFPTLWARGWRPFRP